MIYKEGGRAKGSSGAEKKGEHIHNGRIHVELNGWWFKFVKLGCATLRQFLQMRLRTTKRYTS